MQPATLRVVPEAVVAEAAERTGRHSHAERGNEITRSSYVPLNGIDASPLILLGKIRRLELLFVGDPSVIVPRTTFAEVISSPVATSLPGWHPGLPGIVVEPDVSVPPEVIRHALDPGESMVLALALHRVTGHQDVEVVLDERKGRRAAATLGLSVIGTAGLILRAKAEGMLAASESVRDVLDSLERAGMYLGPELRAAILEAAEE